MHSTDSSISQDRLKFSIRSSGGSPEALGSREFLRSNTLGAYSSSTLCGCGTRRYHGLLVGATHPPVGRVVALSTVMEQVRADGRVMDLATNEFDGAMSPEGYRWLDSVTDGVAVEWTYRLGEALELRKRLLLSPEQNAVVLRYDIDGEFDTLTLRPFTNLRDFHALRHKSGSHFDVRTISNGMSIAADWMMDRPLSLLAPGTEATIDPQWWYGLRYRIDLFRGQDGHEDLYSPGTFTATCSGRYTTVELTANLDEPAALEFDAILAAQTRQRETLLDVLATDDPDPTEQRLALSASSYLVTRPTPSRGDGKSILAGFPWFADWGRDTFLALPGVLLSTGRMDEARDVLATYVEFLSEGMIPNRFDDYGGEPHYNNMDASLWFILAADRYLRAGGDEAFGREVLLPACREIVEHYRAGTMFEIHAEPDGLLAGGNASTQLTWMDAKFNSEAITPRYGKAVEINALWYFAHRMIAERTREVEFVNEAERIAAAFNEQFWCDHLNGLVDCILPDGTREESIRPNQIFAASLPFSPLSAERQARVVDTVRRHLLTPMGLRSLSPSDNRYRRHYGESWESRERAYHQGTVWGWLIGPFIEAMLRVDPTAQAEAREYLLPLAAHLDEACIHHVSEIFDGDAPHAPHGCCAQAWSTAELLRAWQLTAR